MNSKIQICIYISLVAILIAISICIAKSKENNKYIQTSAEVKLSNQKIEWGIKRGENHSQPDLGRKNKELIDKYSGMAMGNKESKKVYLTFDLGYEAGFTANILDTLKKNNVPATFFVTKHYVNTASDLIKRMIDEGHIVGNHTSNHKSMPTLTEEKIKEEVMGLHTYIYEKFGYEMKYLRPPKGEYSQKSLYLTQKLGYTTVMWSFAYADWDEKNQPTNEEGIKKILDNTHNGEIILLHGTSKTNMQILDTVINKMKNMGYEFKSLDEFER